MNEPKYDLIKQLNNWIRGEFGKHKETVHLGFAHNDNKNGAFPFPRDSSLSENPI